MSSLASELVRHPELLDEVFLALGPDNGRARAGDMADHSSFAFFLRFGFEDIDTIGQLLFLRPIMDASGGSSPHPA